MTTDKAVDLKNNRNRTSVLRQLAALQGMSENELQEKWRDLYGSEPPRVKKLFLMRRLAFRIQELFYGGVTKKSKENIREIAGQYLAGRASLTNDDGKILPGTRFIRGWHNRNYETIVRENGFEYNGQLYRSLSAIALAITGTKWNGRKWWGLPDTKKQENNKSYC